MSQPCNEVESSCLVCNTTDAYWNGYNNKKFPQTISSYNQYQQNVIGGINNSKNFRTYASQFTLLKKSLITVQNQNQQSKKDPGDAIKSIPIISNKVSGNKARLITQPHQIGVDIKHNSYDRYISRKKGLNFKCQNC
tara:strand:+ start:623 stop:1033 length:411 start_codon:yes stop_codon:yes gene_type:complete